MAITEGILGSVGLTLLTGALLWPKPKLISESILQLLTLLVPWVLIIIIMFIAIIYDWIDVGLEQGASKWSTYLPLLFGVPFTSFVILLIILYTRVH